MLGLGDIAVDEGDVTVEVAERVAADINHLHFCIWQLQGAALAQVGSWGPGRAAGHFRYFFVFSIIKNYFFALFIKLITYFCTSPI